MEHTVHPNVPFWTLLEPYLALIGLPPTNIRILNPLIVYVLYLILVAHAKLKSLSINRHCYEFTPPIYTHFVRSFQQRITRSSA